MIRNDDELRKFYNEDGPPSHPDDILLRHWIKRLQSGERGAQADGLARAVIGDFRLRQFLGVPQSAVTLKWLSDVLGAIVGYADARETLGLMPRPKNRPSNPQHGWDIACWVEVTIKRGFARADAIQLASDTFFMDVSGVRKLVKQGPQWMDPNGEDWDEYFQLRNRPLPSTQTGIK